MASKGAAVMLKISKQRARHRWSEVQQRMLRLFYPRCYTQELADLFGMRRDQVYHQAARLGLHKSPEQHRREMARTCATLAASGSAKRFQAGHVPYNAGKAGTGLCKPNRGCFKQGDMPRNHKPGTHHVVKRPGCDGYWFVKLAEGKWDLYHKWLWEQANGKVPPRHLIRFIDGDKDNCRVDNLEMVSRAEHGRRNARSHWDAMTPEMRELQGTLGALTRIVNDKKRPPKK